MCSPQRGTQALSFEAQDCGDDDLDAETSSTCSVSSVEDPEVYVRFCVML